MNNLAEKYIDALIKDNAAYLIQSLWIKYRIYKLQQIQQINERVSTNIHINHVNNLIKSL